MTTHALTFEEDLPALLAKIAEAIREHPEVAKGPSSRGILAFLDILRSYAILRKELTKEHIIEAALVTLPHRIQMKSLRPPDELVLEIIEALFSKEMDKDHIKSPSICTPNLPLSEGQMRNIMKELKDFIQRKEEFYRQLDHKKSVGFKDKLTQDDFSNLLRMYPEELKKQFPALSDFFRRMKRQIEKTTKDQPLEMLRLSYGVPNYLEKEELLKGQPLQTGLGTEFSFTQKAQDLMEGPETRKRGPTYQTNQLKNGDPEGSVSKQFSRNMIKDALKSIQNAQDSSSKSISFQNLLKYADPSLLGFLKEVLQENLGVDVDFRRDDHRLAAYDALIDILKNLADEGLIDEEEQSTIKISDKGYAILYEDILAEVDCALMKGKGKHKLRAGKSRNGEDVVDIRRYECEDRFRDIALRRTMREVLKKRRYPEKIQREDIRIKERRPQGCMDVVLALDRSSSMIEHNKFQYARKAAIGLALAAFKNGDRSSVVTFANTATKLSKLTYNVHPILDRITEVRPAGYTNLEDALKQAREILLAASRNAQKHIIIITDGVPTTHNYHKATSQQMRKKVINIRKGSYLITTTNEKERSKHAALRQVKICRANNISCSVVCIQIGSDVDIEFSRKLARVGDGSAHFLKDEKNLLNVVLQDYLEKRDYCVI
ncbi:MAG: VWA domain-containing protein [Promethearchaeota archaeon]